MVVSNFEAANHGNRVAPIEIGTAVGRYRCAEKCIGKEKDGSVVKKIPVGSFVP